MSEVTNDEEFKNSFQFKMEDFDGPLELLLKLVKESKMDIETVHLGDFTGQYLDYIKTLNQLDLEQSTGFILIATLLIEIKSKTLLPQEVEDDAEGDEMDPELLLKQKLIIYEMFKNASQDLANIENVDHFYKAPDDSVGDYRIVIKDMKLDAMLDAFASVLARAEKKVSEEEPKKIVMDRWTVAQKISEIKDTIKTQKVSKFTNFFDAGYTKSEVIVVFLAMLELLKRNYIKVKQDDMFGEIELTYNAEAGDKEGNLNLEEVSYN